MRDGVPWAARTTVFGVISGSAVEYRWGEAKDAGSDGVATWTVTIPYRIDSQIVPCNRWTFYAYILDPNTGDLVGKSATVDADIGYQTRITIAAPEQVATGQEFPVTAKLEYKDANGVWQPLAGQTLTFSCAGQSKTGTTDSVGSASTSFIIESAGTYTLVVAFAGTSTAAMIRVLGFEAEMPADIMTYLSYALSIAPVVVVGGVIACTEVAKVMR